VNTNLRQLRTIRVEEELKAQREIIASLQKEMNTLFEKIDKRFEALEKRLSFLQWLVASGFTFVSILITLVNFLK